MAAGRSPLLASSKGTPWRGFGSFFTRVVHYVPCPHSCLRARSSLASLYSLVGSCSGSSSLCMVGFFACVVPPPNKALQRTQAGGRRFLVVESCFRQPPSLSLEPLGALPLCSVSEGHACSRSLRGQRLFPFAPGVAVCLPGSSSLRSALPAGITRHSPGWAEACSRSPDSEFHAPNHALQRTEAGVRPFSEFHA